MRVITRAPGKITRNTIEAAWRQRNADQRLILRDTDCRGLALIVNPTAMSWTYSYRPRGSDPSTGKRWPNRTVTIGNPATHSPDDARAEANRIKGQVAAGYDPVAEKKIVAEIERRKRRAILGRLANEYEATMARRSKLRGKGDNLARRYVTEEAAQLRLALAEIGATDLPAGDLGEADIRLLLTREGASNTRARFGALSRFLDWAQDAGHISINPCTLIARARRPKAPQPREHYLTPHDLARLWRASERLREPVWRDLARFLMAVPCRRGEAAHLDWSHLNIGAAEWRQPGKLTKNREPHRLHLHPLALDILRKRGQQGKGLVFPAPEAGKAVSTWSTLKRELAAAAGLSGWTFHDFRRSFATALGEAGIPETVADAILNHRQSATRGGVLGVYQRASRWPEQVKAMDLWGHLLMAALNNNEAHVPPVPGTAHQGY